MHQAAGWLKRRAAGSIHNNASGKPASMLRRVSTLCMISLSVAQVAPATAKAWIEPKASGSRFDGVWRSQGYSRLLAIREGVPTLFHTAGPYCYRDPNPDAGSNETFHLVSLIRRDRIAFAEAPGKTRYVFDRIAKLPSACVVEQRWTPAKVGRLIAATFADVYPGFGRRGRTREGLTTAIATLPADATDATLYDRLVAVLQALDDAHVGLQATVDGKERNFESGEAPSILAARQDMTLGADPAARERSWSRRYREGVVALLEGGGHQVANRRILWGRIGGVGYIDIVTMGAFASKGASDDTTALDAALDEALTAFRGLPGVIVDVSNNRGGYDAIGLQIAGRFADRRTVAFDKRAVGATVPVQSFHVEPSARVRYLGPVTLLTSDVTVSAGDTFTLAMRSLPNVRHEGGRTRGALSDQLAKPLPNGWTLTLPAETYRAPDGQLYEGVGITPELSRLPLIDHAALIARIAKGRWVRAEAVTTHHRTSTPASQMLYFRRSFMTIFAIGSSLDQLSRTARCCCPLNA